MLRYLFSRYHSTDNVTDNVTIRQYAESVPKIKYSYPVKTHVLKEKNEKCFQEKVERRFISGYTCYDSIQKMLFSV
jgi:hypothetical protein